MSKRSEHAHRQAHAFEVTDHEPYIGRSRVTVSWVCKCGHTDSADAADVRAAEAYAYRDFIRHTEEARR